ncbi:MAG: SH3 domain-containing protein [Spirochaetota bacterium]|nr:SH3 domain-containing protein [Spirochaetota bacterium]
MNILKILIFIFFACISIIFSVLYFLKDSNINDAIKSYDNEDFYESISILNTLYKVSDYENGERIYYYRVKALNRLAQELEQEYKEELEIISQDDEIGEERRNVKKRVLEELMKINSEIESDLVIVASRGTARIVSNGRFYDQFIARYNGSRLIESLDFEELQKIELTDGDKLINAIVIFKKKYPATSYLPQLFKMIINNLQKGGTNLRGNEDFFVDLIQEYGRRYPTSQEFHRIYICKGNNVNLRNSPGINGSVVGNVKMGDILIQFEKSMDSSLIGDVRDYWYRVGNLSGIQGWIFGKFLKSMEVSQDDLIEKGENWILEESFQDWADSNTPQNWMHIRNSVKASISFSIKGSKSITQLNSAKGGTAGLFRRFVSSGSFNILAKARYVAGNSFVLFAYNLGDGRVYYLKLLDEEINVSGRRIPIHTSDWHEYYLVIERKGFAKLLIDGEIILGRIPPVKSKLLSLKGLYCLVSTESELSLGEIEYLKIGN